MRNPKTIFKASSLLVDILVPCTLLSFPSSWFTLVLGLIWLLISLYQVLHPQISPETTAEVHPSLLLPYTRSAAICLLLFKIFFLFSYGGDIRLLLTGWTLLLLLIMGVTYYYRRRSRSLPPVDGDPLPSSEDPS